MVTFYRFPKEHWKHLRTTNVVESPFAVLRLRTDAAKRYKKVSRRHSCNLGDAFSGGEQRFRKLDAPEKIKQLFAGSELQDELEAWREAVLAVASPFYTPIDGTS